MLMPCCLNYKRVSKRRCEVGGVLIILLGLLGLIWGKRGVTRIFFSQIVSLGVVVVVLTSGQEGGASLITLLISISYFLVSLVLLTKCQRSSK